VTVSGTGSTWTNSGWLLVGDEGDGTLDIANGGALSSEQGHIGSWIGSTGTVTVSGAGSTWTNSSDLYVGNYADGTLNITNGGAVSNTYGYIGYLSAGTGAVTVSGAGSIWTNSDRLYVGYWGNGTLDITNGGAVSNTDAYVGHKSSSIAAATVSGAGSTWTNSGYLYVGDDGPGTLTITRGGLVSVAGELTIDYDGNGDSFINMVSGGMLAVYGRGDDSLTDFLGLIDGTDAIRYWDVDISDWAHITDATYGEDYTLDYLNEGELSGHTLLTVTAVPEPSTLCLAALALLCVGLHVRRRKRLVEE